MIYRAVVMSSNFRNLANCTVLFALATTAEAISLQDAFQQAQRIDPTIRSSKFNQDAFAENVEIAKSRLLPQVSAQGANNQLTQTTTQDAVGAASVSRSFTGPSINHQIVIKQALIRPKDLAAIRLAELQDQYGQLRHQLDIGELRMKVTNAYFDCISANLILNEYKKVVPKMLAAAEQENIKLSLGESTIDAVVEAKAQAENINSLLFQSVQTKKSKYKIFELLTSIDPHEINQEEIKIRDFINYSNQSKNDALINFKEKSLELNLAKVTELMQKSKLLMSKADDMPTMDLLLAVNVAKNDATSTQGYQYKNKQIGIQYSIPLYSGGAGRSAIRQANYIYESSLADSDSIEQKINIEFENTWASFLSALSRQNSNDKLFNASLIQEQAIERSYELGVKTSLDVAYARMSTVRRKIELINSDVEVNKFYYKLNK
jgi:outer membrane protein TolC